MAVEGLNREERRLIQRLARQKGAGRRQEKKLFRNPVAWVLEGFSPMEHQSEYMLSQRLYNNNAIDMLTKGIAKASHINVLLAASNTTQAMLSMGLGSEWAEVANQGYQALKDLVERGEQLGRFICRGPEIGQIKQLMELHDAQLAACTVDRLEQAIKLCKQQKLPRLFKYEIKDHAAAT